MTSHGLCIEVLCAVYDLAYKDSERRAREPVHENQNNYHLRKFFG